MRALTIALLTAVVASTFTAVAFAGGNGNVALCRQSGPQFDVAAAAKTPIIVSDNVTTVGMTRAKQVANIFTADADSVNLCALPAEPAVQAKITMLLRLYSNGHQSQARAGIAALIAQIKAAPIAASSSKPTAARTLSRAAKASRSAAGPCPANRKVTVSAKDAPKVGDDLKAAAAAQQMHDSSAADAATAAASSDYGSWATSSATGATSVTDYVALARGAMQLGNNGAADTLLGKARTAATRDLKAAKQIDRCTATQSDMDCLSNAEVDAQLVGASDSADLAAAKAIADAISDRLQHKPVANCEEWTLQMKMVMTDSNGATWTVNWGSSRFRVNRTTGVIDGSRNAGIGPSWSGLWGSYTTECYETTDAGTVDLGPGSISPGTFTYTVGGTVTSTGFQVNVQSSDAQVSISAPSQCTFLGQLGGMVISGFVKGPWPLQFNVAPGQTSSSTSMPLGQLDIEASISKISS